MPCATLSIRACRTRGAERRCGDTTDVDRLGSRLLKNSIGVLRRCSEPVLSLTKERTEGFCYHSGFSVHAEPVEAFRHFFSNLVGQPIVLIDRKQIPSITFENKEL